jgi:hypothetical protein
MLEDELHIWMIQWLEHALPHGSVVHHSPNEGRRHVNYKMKMKRMGTVSGWPDIELFVPDHGWKRVEDKGPIMIEVKRPKGGSVSPKQKDCHERLRDCGVYCLVAKRLHHIERYLEPLLKLREGEARCLVKRLCEAAGG